MSLPLRMGAPLALSLAFLAGSSAIQAAPVSFSTSGVFGSTGSGTATYTTSGNIVTLAFTGINSTVDTDPFTFTSFGELQVQTASQLPVNVNDSFTLRIFQTGPAMGNGSLLGTFAGTLQTTSSTTLLTVGGGSLDIGGTRYSYAQTVYALVPVSTNNGVTTLQGRVDTVGGGIQETPEPGSLTMLVSGLALVGLARIGRKSS